MKLIRALMILGLVVGLTAGCTTLNATGERIASGPGDRWVVLPFSNYAQMPRAGENVERILAALIRSKGIDPAFYPEQPASSPLLLVDDRKRYQKALAWARSKGFRYGLSGSVNEWRYKAGLDGEPAVGLTVNVIDIESGRVLWSATGARSGWGRESVAMAAHRLLKRLLGDLSITAPEPDGGKGEPGSSGSKH